jgi:hypothetical protein
MQHNVEIFCFYSDYAEGSSLLGCYAVLTDSVTSVSKGLVINVSKDCKALIIMHHLTLKMKSSFTDIY